jgi:hypothetical protein
VRADTEELQPLMSPEILVAADAVEVGSGPYRCALDSPWPKDIPEEALRFENPSRALPSVAGTAAYSSRSRASTARPHRCTLFSRFFIVGFSGGVS